MGSQSFNEFRKQVGSKGSGTFAPDEIAPAGTHLAQVAVALARETKAGNWRLRVKFKVDSGPHAGTSAWWGKNYEPENTDSVPWFVGFCDVMGVNWDELPEGTAYTDAQAIVEFVAGQIGGKRAEIKCALGNEFKGKREVEVKFVNPVPAGSPEPQAKQAASGMAKVASASKPATPGKPAAPAKPPRPANPARDAL